MTVPAAAFDALEIIEGLRRDVDLVLEGEVQTLSYLGFLLSLSAGEEADAWGYEFAATTASAPFSQALGEAMQDLKVAGLLVASSGRLSAGVNATSILKQWEKMPGNRRRSPFLMAAVATARSLSLPVAVRAVHREPQLARAAELAASRALPDEIGLPEMLLELREVDQALAGHGLVESKGRAFGQLFARARVWLSYLVAEEEAEQGASSSTA